MILESNKIEYVSLKANDVLAISKVFNCRDIKAWDLPVIYLSNNSEHVLQNNVKMLLLKEIFSSMRKKCLAFP